MQHSYCEVSLIDFVDDAVDIASTSVKHVTKAGMLSSRNSSRRVFSKAEDCLLKSVKPGASLCVVFGIDRLVNASEVPR